MRRLERNQACGDGQVYQGVSGQLPYLAFD